MKKCKQCSEEIENNNKVKKIKNKNKEYKIKDF